MSTLRDGGSVTRYSDLAGTAVVATTNTTYDAGSRATNIQTLNGSSTVLANYLLVQK